METTPEKTSKKTDKVELAKRIRAVQDWILQDHITQDIINQAMALWSVSDRQAYRYLWAANRFFAERDKLSLQQKVSFYMARKRKLLRDMHSEEKKTSAGVMAVNRVLDSMAKLEGVSVETLKVIGDPSRPIESRVGFSSPNVDYTTLPTDLLRYLLTTRKVS